MMRTGYIVIPCTAARLLHLLIVKDAIHFERRLNNNVRAIDEHMKICHQSKTFLNRDMAKNLLEMEAICDGKDKDRSRFIYDYAAGKVSVSAVIEPESTLTKHEKRQSVPSYR